MERKLYLKYSLYIIFLWFAFLTVLPLSADDTTVNSQQSTVNSQPSDSLPPLPWPQSVQVQLDSLLTHPMFETSQVGLMVWDLDADSCIYRYQEKQLLRPASTMKLITAITAIDQLGGSYQFKTQLKYTGQIENRKLTGDVYCIGGMDPRFNHDDLTAFVESIREMGVDTIQGRLCADKTMKSADEYGEGWCWDDDNPVLSPLLIGRKDCFMERFTQRLRSVGIVLDVETVEARAPQNAYSICTRFHTIDQILMRMMKESDNLYAESMLYQIATTTGARPATAQNAKTVIRRLVNKIGLKAEDYRFADGSGLSLYNYVSAELETMLLRYAYRNDNVYEHLYPSLPIAGVDGTLKKRMKETFANDNVRAKTGTVTGIISLAGYCQASNGHDLCFAIINQGVMKGSVARAFQDRVCNVLCAP